MPESPYPAQPILIVDDEEQILFGYDTALRMGEYNNVVTCSDGRQVLEMVKRHSPEVILLDLNMPFQKGEELLPIISGDFPDIPVLVITGNDTVNTAVMCMKTGAFDYLVKPVSKERLRTSVRQAIAFRVLNQQNRRLKKSLLQNELKNPAAFSSITTINPAMISIFHYVEAVACTNQTVLITGETGVGKELIAKAVHELSMRRGKFVALNISGLDENVVSDTLFGHVKGAFTGADGARKGMVEQAEGGTLFLDEIGDLGQPAQVKLLRLLQEQEYLPLGMDISKRTNTRIVVATNHDLESEIHGGSFRKDLYFRLISHRIHLPALRERLDDLPVLLDRFLVEATKEIGKKRPKLHRNLLPLLFSYHFPGNIRELEAMVFNAVSNHNSKVLPLSPFESHIFRMSHPGGKNSEVPSRETGKPIRFGNTLPTVNEVKGMLIDEALRRSEGNKTLAAKMLGMTRQALNWREKQMS